MAYHHTNTKLETFLAQDQILHQAVRTLLLTERFYLVMIDPSPYSF
jgi:hypothetical protein